MRSTHRPLVLAACAALLFTVAVSAVLVAIPAAPKAGATGLTLQHLLVTNILFGPGSTVTLIVGYTPEPTLTGDSYFTSELIFSGGDPSLPTIAMGFEVDLLTPDSHLAISNLLVTLPSGCQYVYHPTFLLNLSSGLSYHASVNVNGTTEVLYIGCSATEINLNRSGLAQGPMLFHFLLAHDEPPPALTAEHVEATIGYELTFTLGAGYEPPEVETSDHFSSANFDGSNPLIPSATIDFDVALLTPDSHLQISGLAVELPSGCTYTFHPALLLNLSGALTYLVDVAINGMTQVLFAGCSSQEIQLVQLYYSFGNHLVMELTLAH